MTNDNTRILFLILEPGITIENSSVLQSQVIDQIIALAKLGYKASLLCVSKDSVEFQSLAGCKLEECSVPFYLVLDKGLFKNILQLSVALMRLKKSEQIRYLYIRSFWAFLPIILSTPFRRMNFVYDARGDIVDESAARARSVLRQFIIKSLETFAVRRAQHVLSVTKKLAHVVQNRTGIKMVPEVIPCCIDLSIFSFNHDLRAAKRAELGYSEKDVVLVYSGGIAHYQMIPEMISLWRGVLRINSHIKFLLLINSDYHNLVRSLGTLEDFGCRLKVMNLSRNDVFSTLSAADIGFLLRTDRMLNQAASPVKFAEYLAAGLAVVSSPKLGDISELIESNKLGLLVCPSIETPQVAKLQEFIILFEFERNGFRERALLTASKNYNWCSYDSTYQKIYN